MLRILRRFLGDISDKSFLLTISETFHVDFGNFGNFAYVVVIFAVLKLRWNYLPAVLCWDLGLCNIFGCCLVNSCGGLRKGEPVQTWVHLGKSTMPGCEKGCQIGSSEQQVHLQPLCCIWSSGYTFGCVFLCPVCTHH